VTAADRASRERRRLIAASERGRRRRAHALAQQARTADRLDELDRELKAAEAGIAELDAAEAER
jgi:hypothetical protein